MVAFRSGRRTDMLVGIVADTHDNYDIAATAASHLRDAAVDAVLHAGDFTSPASLKLFSGLPLYAVFGNNDWDREGLQAVAAEEGFSLKETHILTFAGIRIFLCHGHTNRCVAIIRNRHADIVVYGHTHQPLDRTVDGVRMINPGALFRARSYTYALLTLPEATLEYRTLPKRDPK